MRPQKEQKRSIVEDAADRTTAQWRVKGYRRDGAPGGQSPLRCPTNAVMRVGDGLLLSPSLPMNRLVVELGTLAMSGSAMPCPAEKDAHIWRHSQAFIDPLC